MTAEARRTSGGTSWIDHFLAIVERTGNGLPHPASLFAILAGVVILLSWIFSLMELSVRLDQRLRHLTGEPLCRTRRSPVAVQINTRVRCAVSRPGRLRADPGDVAVYEGKGMDGLGCRVFPGRACRAEGNLSVIPAA